MAGFPVYGDAGPGGGFRLLDVPTERHTGLFADEAEAMLLLGLSGPAAALGLGTMAGVARDKLLLRLSGPARTRAVRLAERFHLDTDDWYRSAAALPHLPQLARAILDAQRVTFDYQSWTRLRSWQVDPLGIVLKGGRYYLVAAGPHGPTTFAVAAMSALAVSHESFDRPREFDLGRWWAQSLADFEARLRPHVCEVVLTPTGAAGRGRALCGRGGRGGAGIARGSGRRTALRNSRSGRAPAAVAGGRMPGRWASRGARVHGGAAPGDCRGTCGLRRACPTGFPLLGNRAVGIT
jgi:hypothetical protein